MYFFMGDKGEGFVGGETPRIENSSVPMLPVRFRLTLARIYSNLIGRSASRECEYTGNHLVCWYCCEGEKSEAIKRTK
jgi:hypothetical protein